LKRSTGLVKPFSVFQEDEQKLECREISIDMQEAPHVTLYVKKR